VGLNGGWLRYGEEGRGISGEFLIMANIGGSLATMWKWQAKKGPLMAGGGWAPDAASYFHNGGPKKSRPSPMAKLFVAFMVSKEAQTILDNHEFRSSHLVEGSRMATFLREQKVTLQDPKELFAFYLKGGDSNSMRS